MLESSPQQLPLNFPQDFLPERRLISNLLRHASSGAIGDKFAISAETGIPTGESTGKVEPMIHYAQGMGLLKAKLKQGQWQFQVTPVGHCILNEDPYLNESVTQWLLHLTVCRRCGLTAPARGVAAPWFILFAESAYRLGTWFTLEQYVEQLRERFGHKSYIKRLAGLVLRSYTESSCFGNLGNLQAAHYNESVKHCILSAPITKGHFPLYSAYLFCLWDELYPTDSQIGLDDFFEQSYFLSITKWGQKEATLWLEWMADRRLVQLDRQTGKALILRLKTTESVVGLLYSELV